MFRFLEPWVRDFFAVGKSGEILNPKVDPDLTIASRQRLDVFFDQDGYVPTVCGIKGDGDLDRVGSFRETGPFNSQGVFHFGEFDFAVSESESCFDEGSGTAVMLLLEGGIASLAFEETDEGIIEVAKCLLEGDGGDFLKELEVRIGLPQSEGFTGIIIGDGSLIVRPHFFSEFEPLVEDKPTAPDGLPKEACLVFGWVESEFVGSLDHRHSNSNSNRGRFHPRPEGRGFPTPVGKRGRPSHRAPHH